ALAEHLPAWSFRIPGGGLSLWARLDGPVSSALAHAAERHRLRLVPRPPVRARASLGSHPRLAVTLPGAGMLDAGGPVPPGGGRPPAGASLRPAATAPPASTAQVA